MKVEDKSNEITGIPALLELLDITGSIITIDAMGTQTEIAKNIIDKKGDYVLALKANHPTLYNQVQEWFEKASAQQFQGIDVSYEKRVEKGHHRREIRQVWSVPVSAINNFYQPRLWAGLQSVVMVVRVRHLGTKLPVRFSFICLLYTVMLNLLVGLFDNIGVLKTRLIGLLTVHLLRMLAAFALSTVLEILLFYDALLSMPSTANTLINVVSDKK
jgi:predicted transposase YbfD/YdcC